MKTLVSALIVTGLALSAMPAFAADHEVRMLNRGEAGTMVFEPAALHIQPGDTVTFISVDPGHNVETIAGMIPEGAETFRTGISETATITFDVEGVYGLKCTPHLAMGMVALVQVGDDPHNIEDAKAVRQPPAAKKRFDAAYVELGL